MYPRNGDILSLALHESHTDNLLHEDQPPLRLPAGHANVAGILREAGYILNDTINDEIRRIKGGETDLTTFNLMETALEVPIRLCGSLCVHAYNQYKSALGGRQQMTHMLRMYVGFSSFA